HFLALVKLLLDELSRFHSILVRGDVPKKDGETLARKERVDRIPYTTKRELYLVRDWTAVRHGCSKPVNHFRVESIRQGFLQVHANKFSSFTEGCPGSLIQETDAPVPIRDHHAVGGAFEHHRDPSRGVLGLLLRIRQFPLAA